MSGPESGVSQLLPAISRLPTLDDAALCSTLDMLFERSSDLHALAVALIRTSAFKSYDDLIAGLRERLLSLAAEAEAKEEVRKSLHAILGSHPRLGECRASLSAQSAAEQTQLRGGPGGEGEGEGERLAELNVQYETRFPGLRYVVFVAGRGRQAIMQDMRRRIDRRDAREEEKEVIQAMCDIASNRVQKLTGLGDKTRLTI